MTTRRKRSSGSRADPRFLGTGYALANSFNLPQYNPLDWFQKEGLTPGQAALRKSNEDIAHCLAKLKVNAARLHREVFVLRRHIKDFQHPLFETWEADTLTRLIEVAHAYQPTKMNKGIAISQRSNKNPEMVSLAYINAANQVQEETLDRLGLSFQHHQAIRRYEEIAAYRSSNPFDSETPFAKWLIEKKDNRPDKYAFWAKLYPICYGRSVDESSAIF